MRPIDADALLSECRLARNQADKEGVEYANSFHSMGGRLSTEWWCVEDMIENAPTIKPERCDAISRAEAIRVASGYCHPSNVTKELAKPPSVEPERKKGKWRHVCIGKWYGIECTACKIVRDRRNVPHKNGGIVAWNYCPDCGADMRGEEDD